jgi:hypothetical protein
MPGQGNRRAWNSASDQVGYQRRQVGRVDGFTAARQFGLRPPSVAAVVGALEVIQSRDVHLRSYGAVQEEVVPESPFAQPRSAWPVV